MKSKYYIRQSCRLCSSNRLNLVLPLQPTALCDAYVKADRVDHAQDKYPLDLYQCDECGFAQSERYVIKQHREIFRSARALSYLP